MGIDWREDGTIAETFPPLRLLTDMSLDSEHLKRFAIRPGDELTLRWIRGCSRATTIGDLLDVTWEAVLRWPQVGPGRRDAIMRFLAVVSTDAPTITVDGAGHEEGLESIREAASETDQSREWREAVETIGAWAATVSGGLTWADILAAPTVARPADVEEAWSTFAASPLPIGGQPKAQDVLADFLESLDERRRVVLLDRIIGPGKRTLDEIGGQLGVTRERVRQIEVMTRTLVCKAFEDSSDWRSVQWAVEALRARLGVIAPVTLRTGALPGMHEVLQRLVTWLAGYRYEDDLLLADNLQRPNTNDLPRLSPEGRVIDEFETIEAMLAAGVKQELVEEVIDSIHGVTRIDGQLVDWTGGQVARAVAILEVRDEPQGVEDLFELAGGQSLISFRNRIYESDTIIRVTKSKVGLRSWGGTHYTSITDLMAQRLASGPMEIQELAEELERMYEVSASSVAMYADAPAFKVTGRMVALRGRSDAFIPRDKPQTVQGLFRVASNTLLWHVDVTTELLRGSGRSLPQEIGTFLDLSPGDHGLVLRNAHDDVPVTWPDTSFSGPNIGSLRLHAQALGAHEGNILRLAFTAGSEQLRVALVQDRIEGESRAETLARLTGIPATECHDLSALASAISTSVDDVVNTLVKRKDAQVAMAAELVRLRSTST